MRRTGFVVLLLAFATFASAQSPRGAEITILRAEDSRVYGSDVAGLLASGDARLRARAALAAGRIGDEAAIPDLFKLLADPETEVSSMAAFALGEIESVKASDQILRILKDASAKTELRARAVEAAGKIAGANRDAPESKALGEAVLDTLENELKKGERQSGDLIRLGLAAALRARPADADFVIAKFFTNKDARVRADAANAYSRVQGKAMVKSLQTMLLVDEDPVARANAARALGSAGDKTAINLLLEAAETDEDVRVRVNALRAVSSFKEPATGERLIKRGETLLEAFLASDQRPPAAQGELLDAVTAIGNIFEGKSDEKALLLVKSVFKATGHTAVEAATAFAKIDPAAFDAYVRSEVKKPEKMTNWRAASASFNGLAAVSKTLKEPGYSKLRDELIVLVGTDLSAMTASEEGEKLILAAPDLIGVYAALEPKDLDARLRDLLDHADVFVRASAASAIGDRPANQENVKALTAAFASALEKDKHYDDAKLAMLSAIVKLDKEGAKPSLDAALKHYEYLVRRRALELIRENGLEKQFPNAADLVGGLQNYDSKRGSKLGQVYLGESDYERALSRKNGSVRAVVSTAKGKFAIEFFPEEAPLTVDNFVTLAKSGYFDGISIHRVVPNFVVQDGDPRGDGNGGPGWQIRCEINTIPYDRGMVGMALSGKDTGGSQWFITHSPQPHLDGGYTVFGRISDDGMEVVDRLSRGDVITSIEIVE